MRLLPRVWIVLGFGSVLLALVGCMSSLPMGKQSLPPHSGSMTQVAAAAGVFGPLTWAAVALVAAGIVSWMLGNRTRALLMIATGACLTIATLLALELVSLLLWPAVIAAAIAGVTLLAGWLLPKWQKLRGKA
jgi:hypothetical protein